MEKFSTFFGLKLSQFLFSAAEELSRTIQSKNVSATQAKEACSVTRSFYQQHRNEESFQLFYEQVLAESDGKTEKPKLPRYRKLPKKLDDGAPPHKFSTPEEYYRYEYFAVIELIDGELERRFCQKSFSMVTDIERTILAGANGTAPDIPDSLKGFSEDLDLVALKKQLAFLPSFLSASEHQQPIQSIHTLCNALLKSEISLKMFEEVKKLLHIYLTIPVTTSTAERSFSTLRRLKTYLRNTMSQQRMNNLLILSAHRSLVDKLDLQKIAEEFVSFNTRRVNYFGTF